MAKKKKKSSPGELATNRRAYHDYEIGESFEAGLVLRGTEVKSLRNHGGSLQEAYIKVFDGECWLIGAHIAPYNFGNVHNHPERRDRKLLLHKREITKLQNAVQIKGMTIVPLSLYLKQGKIKIKIGIGKGKKKADKRATLKERDQLRQVQKAMKNVG